MFLNHFLEIYLPTTDDLYRRQFVIDGENCIIEAIDTAGQTQSTTLRDQWLSIGEGFILVYSICSRSSFDRVEGLYDQIKRFKAGMRPVVAARICLVGTMADQLDGREVSTEEGLALAKELDCSFFETSSKDRLNMEECFYDIVRALREQRRILI